jgi:2-dehydro-3-deoxyglucarate aldolase/4-hydroxy-2-oxoheptanedioate aldolase
MTPNFKQRLQAGETVAGPIISLPCPDVADLLSRVGFDYLWIDLEHSPMDVGDAQMMIQAAGERCPCIIRVPEVSEAWIKKALDTGCAGIVIPQIRSAAEARAAVAWCQYPPAGRRGAASTRAHAFGLGFAEYVARANENIAIILQVEHIDAVNDIEAMLQTPGITALFVGPFDLSGSMGLLGQVDHPDVQAAIRRVVAAGTAAGMPLGLFVANPSSAPAAIRQGFRMIAAGTDSGYLLSAARGALEACRAG